MSEEIKTFQRWYDKDSVVSKCINILENIDNTKKHQTANFLMNEIISKPPYNEMLPDNIYNLIMEEKRNRRWYDFDEISRIFMELLRYSSEKTRKKIAIKAVKYLEDM